MERLSFKPRVVCKGCRLELAHSMLTTLRWSSSMFTYTCYLQLLTRPSLPLNNLLPYSVTSHGVAPGLITGPCVAPGLAQAPVLPLVFLKPWTCPWSYHRPCSCHWSTTSPGIAPGLIKALASPLVLLHDLAMPLVRPSRPQNWLDGHRPERRKL